MRMRKKKNCAARTERASAYLFDPAGKEGVTCEDLFGRQGPFYLEIGCDQGAAVSGLLRDAGFTDVRVVKDLPGKDRVVCGRRGKKEGETHV